MTPSPVVRMGHLDLRRLGLFVHWVARYPSAAPARARLRSTRRLARGSPRPPVAAGLPRARPNQERGRTQRSAGEPTSGWRSLQSDGGGSDSEQEQLAVAEGPDQTV